MASWREAHNHRGAQSDGRGGGGQLGQGTLAGVWRPALGQLYSRGVDSSYGLGIGVAGVRRCFALHLWV